MKHYIDLHGVLVDFVTGCNKTFDCDIYGDNPQLIGNWDAPKVVIPNFSMHMYCLPTKWWESLPIYPDASLILSRYPSPVILSTLWGNAASYIGTKALIERRFPGVPYVFAASKEVLAHPGALLLDDKDANISAWRAAGGVGVLHPGLMNSSSLRKTVKITVGDSWYSGIEGTVFEVSELRRGVWPLTDEANIKVQQALNSQHLYVIRTEHCVEVKYVRITVDGSWYKVGETYTVIADQNRGMWRVDIEMTGNLVFHIDSSHCEVL